MADTKQVNGTMLNYAINKTLTLIDAKVDAADIEEVQSNLDTHEADTTAHITSTERTTWNAKQDALIAGTDYATPAQVSTVQSNLDTHVADTTAHITSAERTTWNAKQDALTFDSTPTSGSTNPVTSGGIYTALSGKADTDDVATIQNDFDSHEADTSIHITSTERTTWNAKQDTLTAGTDYATPNSVTVAVNAVYDYVNTVGLHVVTTAGDGSAYTATVSGISSLTAGVSFIMVTHTVSTSTTCTLNVNSLGAVMLKRRISTLGSQYSSGYSASWLTASKAFHVVYDGTYWIVQDMTQTAATDLYGTVSVTKGGTGATTAADALVNLGITYGTTDLTAGSSTLATGAIYLCYE